MSKKVLTILLFVFYIINLIINFNSSMMGSKIQIKNILLCLLYLIIWLLFTYYNINKKFTYFYWIMVNSITVITIIVNLTNINLETLIPLVILFLTPLYGVSINMSLLKFLTVIFLLSISFIIFNKIVNKK